MLYVPPAATTGVLRYEWVDPSDVVRDLTHDTSPNLFVSKGSIGLGTIGTELAEEKLPSGPGSVVRNVAIPSARIELPITIVEDSMSDLIDVVENLSEWFDTGDETRRTPGYLRITRPNDTVRQWMCYYAGGLEGDLSRGGPNHVTYVVSLVAPDAWPTAPETEVHEWAPADWPNQSIMNDGQLPAYPIWTITGPGTNMSVQNNTTGKGFSLVYSLAAGKTVTVDTRPPSIRTTLPVQDSDLVNRYPALFPGSKVTNNWLVPGLNSFTFTMIGTNADSRVGLEYLPRYRSGVR